MDDQTTITTKEEIGNSPKLPKRTLAGGSHIFKVSVRAWIALIVISTVCYMSIIDRIVKEPLYTLAGLVVGFFFGQSPKPTMDEKK